MRIIRHHKGGLYTLIGHAVHTERDGEVLVIYATADGRMYARPMDSFYGSVDNGDGQVPRFAPIDGGATHDR